MLEALVQSSRSYRRFDYSAAISMHTLKELVDLAGFCPSAANKQPLLFIFSTAQFDNDEIFACLKWAAHLTEWDGPVPAERLSACIVMVNTAKE